MASKAFKILHFPPVLFGFMPPSEASQNVSPIPNVCDYGPPYPVFPQDFLHHVYLTTPSKNFYENEESFHNAILGIALGTWTQISTMGRFDDHHTLLRISGLPVTIGHALTNCTFLFPVTEVQSHIAEKRILANMSNARTNGDVPEESTCVDHESTVCMWEWENAREESTINELGNVPETCENEDEKQSVQNVPEHSANSKQQSAPEICENDDGEKSIPNVPENSTANEQQNREESTHCAKGKHAEPDPAHVSFKGNKLSAESREFIPSQAPYLNAVLQNNMPLSTTYARKKSNPCHVRLGRETKRKNVACSSNQNAVKKCEECTGSVRKDRAKINSCLGSAGGKSRKEIPKHPRTKGGGHVKQRANAKVVHKCIETRPLSENSEEMTLSKELVSLLARNGRKSMLLLVKVFDVSLGISTESDYSACTSIAVKGSEHERKLMKCVMSDLDGFIEHVQRTNAPMLGEGHEMEVVTILKNDVASVIGLKGRTLKKMQMDTDTKLHVINVDVPEEDDKTAMVFIGKKSNIQKAMEEVQAYTDVHLY